MKNTTTNNSAPTFPSPYELDPPAGAEQWRELYPYYLLFQPELQQQEEDKFWFCDCQHWPNPFRPFDVVTVEFAVKCLGQYNTRHLVIPPAKGIDYRIHNGYCYMSPITVPPEEMEARVPQFMERAGYYYENWNELLDNWYRKVKANIAEMEALTFDKLPEVVPLQWIKDGVGLDNTYGLMENYDRAIQLLYRTWQYHFEFLNLGYAAYLDLFGFLKAELPSIPDQVIAKMVQGVDSELFRPDDEVKKLAKLALDLGVADTLKAGAAEEALVAVADTAAGREWLAAWEEAKNPWFNYTSGNGFYSTDKYWIEHPEIPVGYLRSYMERLEAGEDISRPIEQITAERDRITAEYRELLDDDEVREAFDQKIALARTVYPYVEDHNFYIEHWSMSVFWRKMRELSRMLHEEGFWTSADDMFYLNRQEVRDVLFDYSNAWATGAEWIGPSVWPREIERRKGIMEALSTEFPQPALNTAPEVVTEPFSVMLYGVTSETIRSWAGEDQNEDDNTWNGIAASPGTVEGRARVIRSADQLDEVQQGEILVTLVTAPSWAPIFGKLKATVTDIGGMMSHAAIVCREYGLPAVTGTGKCSGAIQTGQLLRVDGSTGTVTILD